MNEDNSIPICDLHCDTAMKILGQPTLDDEGLQVSASKMRKGNVLLQLFACYLPTSVHEGNRAGATLKMLGNLKEEIAANGEEMVVVKDARSAAKSVEEKTLGCMFGIENGIAMESDIRNLEMFYDRGVRLMTIVHSHSHDWAISSNDKRPGFDGLTAFGETVIAAMNEMGMIVDVSHCHDRTVEKVLSIAQKPVVASHSCARTLCDTERNLSDSLVKGIADNGGMIGVNFFPGFLDMEYCKAFEARAGGVFAELDKLEKKAGGNVVELAGLMEGYKSTFGDVMGDNRVPMDKVIEHIEYIMHIAGDDYVGFGSDFDGIPDHPGGLGDCTGFPRVMEMLAERGHSRETLEKIGYKNFLRVMAANESG